MVRIAVTDHYNEPVPGATVVLGKAHAATDSSGKATLANQPAGAIKISVTATGYKPFDSVWQLPDTVMLMVILETNPKTLEDVVVIATTRGNENIETATTKVEVLSQEDMNEESTLKPGNISSILGDVSGVQIQQSSATTGDVNIRMQGLDGKYTQILRDGMPLFEGYSGGFGVLSIPPLDLKQIELIKGSSSTLYGGGAMAGIINLISKKPSYDPEASVLVNQSTLNETNVNGYYAQRWKKFGLTFFGGQTFQKAVDVNGDGFSDVPKINSTLIHPTLFFYPSENTSFSAGWSGSFEKRLGGDMIAIGGDKTTAHPYYEDNDLKRNTFTVMGQTRVNNNLSFVLKSSLSIFNRDETTNTYVFNGKQNSYYAELSMLNKLGRHSLVAGINTTGYKFIPSPATLPPVGGFSSNTVGVFMQDGWQPGKNTKIEAGLRFDHTDQYKNFFLPRIALFQHIGEHWGSRLGFGFGYAIPNPLSPQIRDYSIYEIQPMPAGITAEKSYGGNIDFNYKTKLGADGKFFVNQSFFFTQVNHPIIGMPDVQGNLYFDNQPDPVITSGSDTYIQASAGRWEFYIGYTYTNAIRKYLATNQFMPITPKNRAAATALYNVEGNWRIGLESSYNGYQYREDGTKTPSYWLLAAMAEKKFGPRWSLVVNCENILDARQSKYESLYTGPVTDPVFKTLWAPIDGRVLNVSLRFQPFAN